MKIPVNNIKEYKFIKHIGYMYSDDHGMYNFYYENIWNFTHFFYLKRKESQREGISMHWKGNPFNLKE